MRLFDVVFRDPHEWPRPYRRAFLLTLPLSWPSLWVLRAILLVYSILVYVALDEPIRRAKRLWR